MGAADNYWIKVASYEPPAGNAPVAPAQVLNITGTGWLGALTYPAGNPSRWVGPRNTASSSPGATPENPAYSLFRKCFCLMPGFQNPRIDFQIRGDNNISAWVNFTTNNLVPAQSGRWNLSPISASTTNASWFRVGRNCIYVLVEDWGGAMGFNLAGTVNAVGLMPVAGAGSDVSFAPCQCRSGPAVGTATAVTGIGAEEARTRAGTDDDSAVVQAILKIAEERRTQRRPR